MKDVPHDGASQGEVVVRAPWLTQGYLHEPERSEELWRGGWLHTGDVGTIDAEGYLKIVDRIKDVVKTGGEWVSSLDIEDLVSARAGHRRGRGRRRARRQMGRAPGRVRRAQARPRGLRRTHPRATSRTLPSAARSRSTRCPIRVHFVDAIPKT
jgi:acyl-CoA synthetase (AMP-forming)/AMP-acid ligase II